MEATVNVTGLRLGSKQICPFDTLALGHRATSTLYSSGGLRVESREDAGGIAAVSGWARRWLGLFLGTLAVGVSLRMLLLPDFHVHVKEAAHA